MLRGWSPAAPRHTGTGLNLSKAHILKISIQILKSWINIEWDIRILIWYWMRYWNTPRGGAIRKLLYYISPVIPDLPFDQQNVIDDLDLDQRQKLIDRPFNWSQKLIDRSFIARSFDQKKNRSFNYSKSTIASCISSIVIQQSCCRSFWWTSE